jgi:hypothetical protein
MFTIHYYTYEVRALNQMMAMSTINENEGTEEWMRDTYDHNYNK